MTCSACYIGDNKNLVGWVAYYSCSPHPFVISMQRQHQAGNSARCSCGLNNVARHAFPHCKPALGSADCCNWDTELQLLVRFSEAKLLQVQTLWTWQTPSPGKTVCPKDPVDSHGVSAFKAERQCKMKTESYTQYICCNVAGIHSKYTLSADRLARQNPES